jgi:hypothetical protein
LIAFGVLLVSTVGERFGTVDLTAGQWAAALALALVPLIVPELWKLRARLAARTPAPALRQAPTAPAYRRAARPRVRVHERRARRLEPDRGARGDPRGPPRAGAAPRFAELPAAVLRPGP